MAPGKLITFEGIDRAGKTTVVGKLVDILREYKATVVACGEMRSPIASAIREMLQAGSSPFIKTFMFAADRAWSYENICLPALQEGNLVLWDRYVDTAIVYRAVELSRGESDVDLGFVREINKLFKPPDLTFYIDISENISEERSRRVGQPEIYDKDFLKSVRVEYMKLSETKGYVVVNGERSVDDVVSDIANVIKGRFKESFR